MRGVFVGFSVNQAGWLVFIPSSKHVLSSADVRFDEEFASVSALPNRIYHDSFPINPPPKLINDPDSVAHTGPPIVNDKPESGPWTPYTALPPEADADQDVDPNTFTDTFTLQEDLLDTNNEATLVKEDDEVTSDADADDPQPWYEKPTTRSQAHAKKYAYAN